MSTRPMKLYFDFISPYAHLAWRQLPRLKQSTGKEIEPVPVLLAAMLTANGQKGPAEIPSKRLYTFKNVLRLAHEHGVSMSLPKAHPFNPLLALRLATLHPNLIEPLFAAIWEGGPGADDPEVLARHLSSLGHDGEALVSSAGQARELLKQHTQEAMDAGAFGVPSILVDGELFWGFDSFPHIERFVQGRDPVDAEFLTKLASLPVGASRIQANLSQGG